MNASWVLSLCAASSLAFGCRKAEPSPGRATPATVGQADASVVQRTTECARKVRRLTFTGCNPLPSQHAYPECTSYDVGPATEHADHGCIPGLLRLSVSGYPGQLDVALVEAKVIAAGSVELIVNAHLESTSDVKWIKGTQLGELVLREDRVESLVLRGEFKLPYGSDRLTCPGVDGSVADCTLSRGDPR